MPRRRRQGRRRHLELTSAQEWELLLGAVADGAYEWIEHGRRVRSEFPSPEVREAAWWANRDESMALNPGHRAAGWWWYESGVGRQPAPGTETLWLAEHGQLERSEAAVLLTYPTVQKDRRLATAVRRALREGPVLS